MNQATEKPIAIKRPAWVRILSGVIPEKPPHWLFTTTRILYFINWLPMWSLRVVAPLGAGLLGYIILYSMLVSGADITPLGLTSVLIFATLAAVLFAYGACLNPGGGHRQRIIFAGERFLLAVVLALFATILYYGRNESGFFFFLGWIAAFVFFQAYVIAFGGMMVLNNVLWKRCREKQALEYVLSDAFKIDGGEKS
jgi:hypothetical protein